MARSVSCNNKCPQCWARITLPQAFNMQKINEVTSRLRQGVLAMDSLLHQRPFPRVVPPRATPPVSVSLRLSPPMSASPRITVPALAPPTTSSGATIVLSRTAIAVPVTAVPALFATFARNPVPPEPATPEPLPTTSTPDQGPPTAPQHVSSSTRAPPPNPAPPRITLTAASRSTTMLTSQQVNDGTTSGDVPAVIGQGPHIVNGHLARPAVVTTRPGERAADAADRGTLHGPPTRAHRYATDLGEPESESEPYCDEVLLLTRQEDSDDLDDLPYYNCFQPARAPRTSSTTNAATTAPSLADSNAVHSPHLSTSSDWPMQLTPSVRLPPPDHWPTSEDTPASEGTTTRYAHSADTTPAQSYGTTAVAPNYALAGAYTSTYTLPSYLAPPPSSTASGTALPCEYIGVPVRYARTERFLRQDYLDYGVPLTSLRSGVTPEAVNRSSSSPLRDDLGVYWY
jgi:hypothetical protein